MLASLGTVMRSNTGNSSATHGKPRKHTKALGSIAHQHSSSNVPIPLTVP